MDVTDVGNELFFKAIRSPAHRGQCLYHVPLSCSGCRVVCMYIIGDDDCVNRVVAIHFDAKIITTVRDFLTTSYKKYP